MLLQVVKSKFRILLAVLYSTDAEPALFHIIRGITRDDKFVLVSAYAPWDTRIKLFSLTTFTEVRSYNGLKSKALGCALSADNKYFVIATKEQAIKVRFTVLWQ